MEEHFHRKIYKIGIDASFSCPHRDADGKGGCIFCDGSGSVSVYQRGEEKEGRAERERCRLESIDGQIRRGMEFVSRRYKADAALYFQAWSNTYAPVPVLKAVYDHALSLGSFPLLIISTRPDCITDEIAALLSSYQDGSREVWVELGLQSADDETLRRINRGHDTACFINAVKILKRHGLRVSAHLMVLPSFDTLEAELKGIRLINELGIDGVKIHNLHILRGTVLEKEYLEDGCITTSSVRRHVERVSYMLASLSPEVVIERLLSESTRARLVYPDYFPDKRDILAMISSYMEQRGWKQGSLLS